MSRPRKKVFSLAEKLRKLKESGFNPPDSLERSDITDSLKERIKKCLNLLQTVPKKAVDMTFLVLYDIEDNKVRNLVAKYLLGNGCIRIQKSVFIASLDHKMFEQIHSDLKEVQEFYENNDSIILVPFNTSDMRSMKVIGRNLQLETIVNKPNAIFF